MGGRTPLDPESSTVQADSQIWSDVWASNDEGRTWSQIVEHNKAGHWPARAYFEAITHNNEIIVLGGQNFRPRDESGVAQDSEFFNDVWASQDGITWTQRNESAPWQGRAGLSAASLGDYIYVMAGSVNDDVAIVIGPPTREYFNDVWRSTDGRDWELVTDSAPWKPRAGATLTVKDSAMYLMGGEDGFVCGFGTSNRCPPYFGDVWRSANGSNWELVTQSAPWRARPGQQVVVANDQFVLFGGFGLNPNIFQPFAFSNPTKTWVSQDANSWYPLGVPAWDAERAADIKYDFDALVSSDPASGKDKILTFGGDRETFNFNDPANYLRVDSDVSEYAPSGNKPTNPEMYKDAIEFTLRGALNADSELSFISGGDVTVDQDASGVSSVQGQAETSGEDRINFAVRRIGWLPLYSGSITLQLNGQGPVLRFPALLTSVNAEDLTTVSGLSRGFVFASWRLAGPLRISWRITDRGYQHYE